MWSLLSVVLSGCGPGPSTTVTEPDPWIPGEPLVQLPDGPPKNLLMLSIDTLRRDHVGPYAPDGVGHMPFLASWLEASVHMADHQQCSNWTYASTVCTLNGRANEENGFFPKIGRDIRVPVPDGQRTLARILEENDFLTLLISSNSWLSEEWNNAQGYEYTEPATGGSARLMTSRGLTVLQDQLAFFQPERWFLHMHVIDPHVPYNAPDIYLDGLDELEELPIDVSSNEAHYEATERWTDLTADERDLLEAHLRVRYAANLAYLDAQLERWWNDVEQSGLLKDTLVVIWTDHGEQFWEHGWQSHAYGLAAEETDGILAFRSAGLQPRVYDGPTVATDMVPTLLHALGLEPSPAATGLVIGTEPPDRVRFLSTVARLGPIVAATKEDWKLQFRWNTGERGLWQREADPTERIDLFVNTHPKVQELWPLLRERTEMMQPLVEEVEVVWP
ncbi:MAG: sulfatase-like hydrolase/transferase [Myxococcales bacterium]|nr:sulfatase-like hydrolase/transferase [Myxococcales bacterium]